MNIQAYNTLLGDLVSDLAKKKKTNDAEIRVGRKFDRVIADGRTHYFVDRHTWDIFGAKSDFQHNPRRWYGTLQTVQQVDWFTGKADPGSEAEKMIRAHEAGIKATYKPRGRPRKKQP